MSLTTVKTGAPANPFTLTTTGALTAYAFVNSAGTVCTAGQKAIGVTDVRTWTSGSNATIYTGGINLVEAAGTITAGDHVMSDGSGNALKWVAPVQAVNKTADQALTETTTLTDDTHLVFTSGPSQVWIVEYNLVATNADSGAARSIKINFDDPTGTTIKAMLAEANATADTLDVTTATNDLSSDISVSIGASGTAYIRLVVEFTVSTTAGDVTLQWAQVTSDTDAITMKAGSNLIARVKGNYYDNGIALDAATDGTLLRVAM